MFQDVPVPAPVRWRWNDKILIPEQRPINHLLYSVYVIQLNILWEQVRFGPWQWFHLTQAFFFFLIDWFLQRQLPHIWFFNFSSDWFISKMDSLTCCWYLSHKTSIFSSLPPSFPCASDAILQNFRLNKIPDCTRREEKCHWGLVASQGNKMEFQTALGWKGH